MHPPGKKFASVAEYHSSFPDYIQHQLDVMRALLQPLLPNAEEVISYNMPAFKLAGKIVVYYAGYKHHIGFYPLPAAIKKFENELAGYTTSKGAIQFPIDKPLPAVLVKKIVKYRLAEVAAESKPKKVTQKTKL